VTLERPTPPDQPFGFHISPRPGRWLNDPNGPIYWQGRYHLFHQPNWCHSVSDDLARWTVLSDAIPPTPGGPDRGGAWSGSTVVHDDRAYALYTGADETADRQVICLAVSDGPLSEWHKDEGPVIAAPPVGLATLGWRDPFVFRYQGDWLCLVGGGVPGRAQALLYSSANLRSWRYEGVLYQRASEPGDRDFTGELWECPFFVPIGDRYLLGISVWYRNEPFHTVGFVGDFDGNRFEPARIDRLDHGPDYYAPTALVGPDGRCLIWGWAWEAHAPGTSPYNRGGCLTVTRQLTMSDDQLRVRPVRELEDLRTTQLSDFADQVAPGHSITLTSDGGTSFDVVLAAEVPDGCRLELEVLASHDGRERTVVFIDRAGGECGLDTRESALAGVCARDVFAVPLAIGTKRSDARERSEVRVLRDSSILEVFIDGRSFTVRVAPTLVDATAVRVKVTGGRVEVCAQVWTMSTQAIEFAS
jgi:beta-fructofuranosidase